MLILSRKCGEKIVIPEQNVTLTVLGIRGDRIRLGIAAPPDVSIHREEVWQRIQQFQEPAPAEAVSGQLSANERLVTVAG
jgi:carbon storage regulator